MQLLFLGTLLLWQSIDTTSQSRLDQSMFEHVLHVCVRSSCEECFDPFGGFVFYIFCVRVTESGEVGYGTVTV